MIVSLKAATVLLMAAVMSPPIVTNNLPIPKKYTSDTSAAVYFVDQDGINKGCGKSSDPRLYKVACAFPNKRLLYLPNPCKDKDAKDPASYAHKVCHEIAHLNGWHHVNE